MLAGCHWFRRCVVAPLSLQPANECCLSDVVQSTSARRTLAEPGAPRRDGTPGLDVAGKVRCGRASEKEPFARRRSSRLQWGADELVCYQAPQVSPPTGQLEKADTSMKIPFPKRRGEISNLSWLCCATLSVVTATTQLAWTAAAANRDDFEVRPGFTVIGSLAELRDCLAASGQKIRMRPGVYQVVSADQDHKTVFHVGGSGNYFDLRGVTIQIDTKVLAALRGKVHELAVYRVPGSNLTFEGALFEDVGDEPPYHGLSDFSILGNGNTFKDCTFIVRGSAPYGYGDLFGKGAGAKVHLQKHAAMSVHADNTKILGCRYFIRTFGHAIHMHGAQNTLVQDVYVEGALRRSDEILAEKDGPAARLAYKDHDDRPIPKGVMICLAEDGIRAYHNGGRDQPERLTGDITVVNCTVKRMRGGITLALASGKVEVRGCTVTESGYPGDAYSVPSAGLIRNCRGDAAYTPLLRLGYSHKQKADVELELLDSVPRVGNDLLALINGHGHKVTITPSPAMATSKDLVIAVAQAYRGDEEDVGKTAASNVELNNRTAHRVLLSPSSSDCTVRSLGPVTDQGTHNTVMPMRSSP